MRDPAERLRDIVEAIAAIERHSNGEKEAFERDELLQTRCAPSSDHRRSGSGNP